MELRNSGGLTDAPSTYYLKMSELSSVNNSKYDFSNSNE